MLRHRHRLRRWRGDPNKQADYQQLLETSVALANSRREKCPQITFEQDLPILSRRQEIAACIRQHQVVIISGETGSGKSTQLPKICLESGFGVLGFIGHTQPRRIAARSISNRIAEELGQSLGQGVGFKIRFTDKTSDQTYIKLMTDGILLAEIQSDRFLDQYEVLIIDEAHERSLNIDFLLGFLYQLLPKRPELRVIITSATIDAERFAQHFATAQGPAPIIEVSGRNYPVELRYRPLVQEDEELNQTEGIVAAIQELAAIDRGHILVFLPTERDIRETAKRLRHEKFPMEGSKKTEILPLYARLPAKEQNRVFQPADHRRIVLATNVAESSLTVPGIRYVVDTGTARISRYAPRSKVQRLPIEPVSRASADQRKGRCGRVAEGICIRLFDEQDFDSRSAYTTPEIQRTNLASVILQATALKLGRVEDFPFIDPPRPEAIRDGYRTLHEIGAVDDGHQLTALGRKLSRLPVDPRIARIIVAADEHHCLAEILIIAAALTIQDPRERPVEKQQQADECHAKYATERSDFMSYLKLWDFYHDLKEQLSRNKLHRACVKNFLSYNRLREWTEIHRQLLQLLAGNRLSLNDRQDNYDDIHKALLTGFLSGVAYRSAEYEYTGAGGIKFHLWPGSCVFDERPSWGLAAELVETRRRYGRTVATIKPQWIEPIADHVVKRQHSDPHWHRKSGRVVAWERVTLFGMPIVNQRRVPFGPINLAEASEIFVRDGLAKRDIDCQDKFYQHNESIIQQCESLAAKARKAEYVADEYALYRFYNQRLPIEVHDLESLRKWIRADAKHRELIRLKLEDLATDTSAVNADSFPDEIAVGTMNLPLSYAFEPGEQRDGVTLSIPQEGLAQLDARLIDWGVPGFLEEKIVALIRSLPKSIRRGLIPAPDTAREVAAKLQHGEGSFLQQASQLLSQRAGESIPMDAFKLHKMPEHLRVNIRVVDEAGEALAESRDLAALRDQFDVNASVEVGADENADWHRDHLREWDFGDLPKAITLSRGGVAVDAYPAIMDNGEDVHLRLVTSSEIAQRQSQAGVRRLFALKKRKALRSQVNWLPRLDEISVLGASLLPQDELKRQLSDLIADRACFRRGEKVPRTQAEFEARVEDSAERIGMATQDVAKLLPKLFEGYQTARLALEECQVEKWRFARNDAAAQIAALTVEQFLVHTPWQWLESYPRYFQAIAYRFERLRSGSAEKDRVITEEIAFHVGRYAQQAERNLRDGTTDPHLEDYRWMIEEYRVSCHAQQLGTCVSVSEKKLEKQWNRVAH